jgi:hypothetical protein
MTAYPRLIDLSGWMVVVLAGLLAIVALVGIAAVLYASSPSALSRAEQTLHETYYVIQPSRAAVVPFATCLVLACAVGFLGYSQTRQFVEPKVSIIEPDGAANGSQPIRSETNRASSAAGSRR